MPAGVTKVASVEGITEYRLPNGLRVLLFPDNSKATTTVNVTYLVGSRHEGYGETGMAHLLEHMVFKGSTNHKNIPQELTEHGARPNGSTWYDRTNYFETFAATDENLQWALDLEADRMVNSFIAKKDLETEFSVVRNEFEMGENSPQRVLMERILSSAYLWHNYGKSTIGSKEDIERVPIDNLQAFYKRYYQPDNAVLVVAGKMDEPKTLALVSQTFGAIAKPARTLPTAYTTEPTQDGERDVTLRRVGDTQGLGVAYHTPAGTHPDYATLDVLMDVLTNEPSGRLYKALIDTKKAAYTYGWTPALHDPGFAYFYAEVRQQQPPRLGPRRHAAYPGPGRPAGPDRRGSGPRQDQAAHRHRAAVQELGPGGAGYERVDCGRRLAPDFPLPRQHPQGNARRRAARGRGLLEALEPHGGRVHPRPEARPRRDSRRTRRDDAGQGLQGREGRGRRGSLRRLAGPTSRSAPSAGRRARASSTPCCPKAPAATA